LTAEPSPGGLLAIGRVSRAHGLKGELRVELFFDGSDALDQVDELWLAPQNETPSDAHRHVIVLHAFTTAGTDLAELEICYQPNGEVYFAVPPLQPLARQPNTTLITLSVTRTVDNRPHGESREVIFPAGGSARAH